MEDEIVRLTAEQLEQVRAYRERDWNAPVRLIQTDADREMVRRFVEAGKTSWRDGGSALLQVL